MTSFFRSQHSSRAGRCLPTSCVTTKNVQWYVKLSGFFKRSLYQIQKLLHNKNLKKRLEKEIICRQTDMIINNSWQKFHLWLLANPTLHSKVIKGQTIRNRSLTEENDVAVLCINHPNEKNCRFCIQWKSGNMHKKTKKNIDSSPENKRVQNTC